MQMPEMSGIQLAQAIRKIESHTPIILLSSIGDERSKERNGLFSAVLTKPVKQSAFWKITVETLKGNSSSKLSDKAGAVKEINSTSNMRILIVDDNVVNQKLASRILAKIGYQYDTVADGQDAVDVFHDKRHDIILMDVQMPGMDGLEATRIIRQRNGSHPVIIAMTANAMESDREECVNAGMDDYISKPIKKDDMVSMIEKWVGFVARKKSNE
jgi:CheY-like chemotaxis protein